MKRAVSIWLKTICAAKVLCGFYKYINYYRIKVELICIIDSKCHTKYDFVQY